ncbi:PAS domain-containing sensor histidine kinase [Mucilaginibacter ginkgonis]|uniref:histidine kinase n=1 Tax=Mucilaginibacter ginkgonis TaxID=2682091 RepID=A0A6I4INW4_9SPHI|nr:PAS domain-containing sensor histidine kinase [Mucilaginibacter ginkgonis]QQL48943.1 PAS domain-containing sensor histidine kinase [Mucilaginibacter ginkgonis]
MPERLPFIENEIIAKSETHFAALVTAFSDVIYRMSPDWSVLQELDSNSFLKNIGSPTENWVEQYIHPLDQELVIRTYQDAIANKRMFQLEHRVLRADGSIGWTSSRAVPIFGNHGEVTEWFGAANDITERKRTEEALQVAKESAEKQKRLYETITANTPDLIYVFELDYTFSYVNQALLNMWGKTWDNAVGLGLRENGYEEWHAQMHEREIDHIVATKEQVRGVVNFPHATLGTRSYDYILSPVLDADGNVQAVSGTTRDISEIKETERRKNDFINMVSHELKTPLTSTVSYVQIAEKRAADNHDSIAANMLNRAKVQLSKMTRMINGFLNVSRLQAGKMDMDMQRFQLQDLLEEVRQEAAITITTHNLIFAPIENVWLTADKDKIEHVFINLISNAAKYSPIGSPIYITGERVDGHIQFNVKDDGMGINPAEIPLLFEPYYRVKEAEAKKIAGFGIGLYLSAEVVKRHNGSIWADSEAGKGSIFHFTLPIEE